MTVRLRCEIFPGDLDRTVDFYVGVLAFTLLRDERHEEVAYIHMRRGDVFVGALGNTGAAPDAVRRPPVGVELVLEVDDLDAERERVAAAGWPLSEDVVEQAWGLRDFRLVDPDGYYWRITTHGGSRRGA